MTAPHAVLVSISDLRAMRLGVELLERLVLREAVRMLGDGASATEVAGALGISRSHVYRIRDAGVARGSLVPVDEDGPCGS